MVREPMLGIRAPLLRLAQASLRRGELLPCTFEPEDGLLLADRQRADLIPRTGKRSFDRSYATGCGLTCSARAGRVGGESSVAACPMIMPRSPMTYCSL